MNIYAFNGCFRLLSLGMLMTVITFGSASAQIPTNRTVVRIEATQRIAEESSAPFRRLPLIGRFTISRTGPTNASLSVFVLYGGTATSGVDYKALPWSVSIPAGATSVDLEVAAIPDQVAEPIESVEARLSQCPPLTDPPLGIPCRDVPIDPAHSSARVFIREDGITPASLEITAPKDGAEFKLGTTIPIEATAIDFNGAITAVDFYDGDTKIGESRLFFFVQPEPGTPIYHQFDWTGAGAGSHKLNVRAINSAGNGVTSPPVAIQVVTSLPVVSIEASTPETIEPSPTSRIRPGAFTLRRTGGTNDALRVFMAYRGTAMPGGDYTVLPNPVEIPAGASSTELPVGALDDSLVEGDETVVAEITQPPFDSLPTYEIDPNHTRAQVVIHDNDGPLVPVVGIAAIRPETSELPCPPHTCLAPVPAPSVFQIQRTGNISNSLAVLIRVGGTATPRSDYDPVPELVQIPAGQASVELFVQATFDELAEGDETVVVELMPDASLSPIPRYQVNREQNAARVIIHDRTPPPVQPEVSIVATDPLAREGTNSARENNTATFVIRRTGETNNPLTVFFEVGGTATNGADYKEITSPVVIPAGHGGVALTVVPSDDHLTEPPETVLVKLIPSPEANPLASYNLGTPRSAAAIILDNDFPRPPCTRLSDGVFNLCIPVKTNGCFRVEGADSLTNWIRLCTIPINEGAAHFLDPNAPDLPRRFYRIVPDDCEAEP